MMIRFKAFATVILAFIAFSISTASAQDIPEPFYYEVNGLLSTHVKEGAVRYRAIAEEPARLNEIRRMIENQDMDTAIRETAKAFYINAYNILTIHSIIEHGIPDSPMDVEGFFDKITHAVAGRELTLNEIEKEILFQKFTDTRMHFALVCAARGCPPLQPFAYQSPMLESQLNTVTRRALNDPKFIRVDDEHKSAAVSQIFKWYEQDFLKEADSVLAYINQYRDTKIPANYAVKYYEYDWSLNGR